MVEGSRYNGEEREPQRFGAPVLPPWEAELTQEVLDEEYANPEYLRYQVRRERREHWTAFSERMDENLLNSLSESSFGEYLAHKLYAFASRVNIPSWIVIAGLIALGLICLIWQIAMLIMIEFRVL